MLSRLLRKHRRRLLLVMSLYLLLVAMASLSPLYLARLVDELSKAGGADVRSVSLAALLMILASVLNMGIGFFLTRFLGRMSIDIATETRTQVLTSYLAAEQERVPETGEFMTAMVRDVSRLAGFITQDLGSILISVASFLGVSLVLVRMNWLLYLLLSAFVPVFWFTYRRFVDSKYRLAKWLRQANAALTEELTDAAGHQRTIYLHRCQPHAVKRLRLTIAECNRAEYGNILQGAWSGLALSGVSFAMNTATLLLGVVFVLRGNITVGMLLAFTTNSNKLLAPVASLTGIALSWQETKIALENLARYVDRPGFADRRQPGSPLTKAIFDAVRPFAGAPEFCVELDLPAVTSLVGATGAGKSTLCAGLAGYLRPLAGSIRYRSAAGQLFDVRAASDGIMLIDTHMRLFAQQSIRDNLTLGGGFSDAAISAALTLVELAGLFRERGIELGHSVREAAFSHGEAQRLLLARGVLARPGMLILDEALSGLDPALAQRIIGRLKAIIPSLVLVSHRASDHQLSERVYLIEQGQVRPIALSEWMAAAGPA